MSKSDTPQIEPTALEPIPSAGAEEVAELNHAVYGLGDREQFIVTDGKEVERSAELEPEHGKEFFWVYMIDEMSRARCSCCLIEQAGRHRRDGVMNEGGRE